MPTRRTASAAATARNKTQAPKARALLVGLTHIDPAKHNGDDGRAGCAGCETDVRNMQAVLSGLGYEIHILLNEDATGDAVLGGIREAREDLSKSGGTFFFYAAAHGGQVRDFDDDDDDEEDGLDETLVCFDRHVIDDELYKEWIQFPATCELFLCCDCCNAATNYRFNGSVPAPHVPKLIESRSSKPGEFKADLLQFGGCRDGATSAGRISGGDFTLALVNFWNGGTFGGSWTELHRAICARLREIYDADPRRQTLQEPQLITEGPNRSLIANRPALIPLTSPLRQLTGSTPEQAGPAPAKPKAKGKGKPKTIVRQVAPPSTTVVAHTWDDDYHYAVQTTAAENEGGQALLRSPIENPEAAEILHADTTIFPLPAEAEVPAEVAAELALQLAQLEAPSAKGNRLQLVADFVEAGALPTDRGLLSWLRTRVYPQRDGTEAAAEPIPDADARLAAEAAKQIGRSSSEGPSGGKLACVWMVRRIYRDALGVPLTATDGTSELARELKAGRGVPVDPAKVRPGHLIISPTEFDSKGNRIATGHVGIVGEDGLVYSNSSRRAQWEQNYTLTTWKAYYQTSKKLKVLFYDVTSKRPAPSTGSRDFSLESVDIYSAGSTTGIPVASVPPPFDSGAATPLPQATAAATSALTGEEMHRQILSLWEERSSPSLAFARGSKTPLVAEGDSWFDFSPIGPDVLDWLERDYGYDIKSFAKAGACVYEMAYGVDKRIFGRDPAQLELLVKGIHEHRPRAVLLSGGGNDFAGPEFILTIHHALANPKGINEGVLKALFIDEIEPGFRLVIGTALAAGRAAGLGELPIVVHGYDYPFPDGRKALNLGPLGGVGPWMRDSFMKKGYAAYKVEDLQKLVARFINELYAMHERLKKEFHSIRIVNVRGTLPRQSDWHDELHPTTDGFRAVAAKFQEVIGKALAETPVGARSQPARYPFFSTPHSASRPEPSAVATLDAAALSELAGVASDRAAVQALAEEGLLIQALTAYDIADAERHSDTRGFSGLNAATDRTWKALGNLLRKSLRPGAAPVPAATEQRAVPSLDQVRDNYLDMWKTCVIRPERRDTVAWYIKRLLAGRSRYEKLGDRLRIPWHFIAVIHTLECDSNFNEHLHNGDPLTERTVRVPAHRPAEGTPPFTWEASAIDALTMKGKEYDKQTDWSLEAQLFRLERYNGLGYYRMGKPSPYLWSFSNHYTKGKYVRDYVYDPDAVSRQVGAAVLMKELANRGVIKVG